MRILMMTMMILSLINLVGCTGMSGNVVPQSGPTMEEIYDSVQPKPTKAHLPRKKQIRRNSQNRSGGPTQQEFQKINNPELKMYVYPHLAGKDKVPIPGYETVFNAYERDHYQLIND